MSSALITSVLALGPAAWFSVAALLLWYRKEPAKLYARASMACWFGAALLLRADSGHWSKWDVLLILGLVLLCISVLQPKHDVGVVYPMFFSWVALSIWAWFWYWDLTPTQKVVAVAFAGILALASRAPSHAYNNR